MVSITTGTMATIWLEQITSRGIGNGVSMLIFAVLFPLPSAVWELGGLVKNNEINVVFVVVVLLMFVAVVALVVYEQQGQRKIPVHYAKRVVA